MESIISRPTAEFIADSGNEIISVFLDWLKDTQFVEDVFFPTIGSITSHQLGKNGHVIQGKSTQ